MTYLRKTPPPIDTLPQPGYTGYIGSMSRATGYDGPLEELWMRGYLSYKTPNFKAIKKRDRPVNTFYAYSFILKDNVGAIWRTSSGYRYEGVGKKVMGLSLVALKSIDQSPIFTDRVMSASVMKCLKKASNLKFNAAQAFAERKQTAGLLITSVNRLATFVVAFRNGNFVAANRVLRGRDGFFGVKSPLLPTRRKPFKTRDAFANSWLEYSYGWRPLLGDIFGSAEMLANLSVGYRPVVFSGTDRYVRRESIKTSIDEGLQGLATVESIYHAKTVLHFQLSNAALDALKSTGLSNPALLAWELVPYSFVVDWVLPIGSYLEAVNASSGLDFVKGSTSLKTVWHGSAHSTTNGSIWSMSNGFPATLEAAQLYRKVFTTLPPVPLPSLKLDLNLSQVFSSLALIHTTMKR